MPTHFKTVRVGDTEVFYREAGHPDRPTILLLHGFPTSSHMFRELIPLLATQYHVVAPDLPGFGFTQLDSAQPKLTFDKLTDTIEDFAETLKLDRYALYVFDYGAPVGWRLATRHPEKVLALISQNGNAYEEGLSEAWAPLRNYWKAPSAENRSAIRALLSPEATKWQYTHGTPDPTRVAPEAYTLDALLMQRPGNETIQLDLFLDYANNVAQYPTFHKYFRDHQPPLLAVWGKNDPFFLPAGAEAFKRDLPQAQVHFFDTGHFALETHVQEISTRILDFLEEHLGKSRKALRSNLDTVKGFYTSLAAGDVPGVLGLLDAQVQWTEAQRFPYYTGTWIGPQAVLNNLIKRLVADWNDFKATPKDFLVEGSNIVSFGTYTGIYKKTGKPMSSDFAHLWTVKDGKLTRFLMYTDTAKILEAMQA
jgi:pimeloyl-ACP methyl ester carboxylesterase/ketosteroid isomerase-like protein